MTRPEQPQPYPGDVGEAPAPRGPVALVRDYPGMTGKVYLRDSSDNTRVVDLASGRLITNLRPGEPYRLLAVLQDAAGVTIYERETVIL